MATKYLIRQDGRTKAPWTSRAGRVFLHVAASNGSWDLVAADGGDMSGDEWADYCNDRTVMPKGGAS